MSTLAAEFLKRGRSHLNNARGSALVNDLQDWTAKFIMSRLLAPLPTGDLRQNASQYAERYVFDEDAPNVTTTLVQSGAIASKLVWDTVRLPAQNVWIEFPLSRVDRENSLVHRIGYMVGQLTAEHTTLQNPRTAIAVVVQTVSNEVACVGLISTTEIRPVASQLGHIDLHWFLSRAASEGAVAEHNKDAQLMFKDLIDCLFLITTPRVSEFRTGSFGHRKPSVQKKEGSTPFVEYRRVTLKVGVSPPHYKRDSTHNPDPHASADASRRKLHRCIGHFRTYVEGREQPHVSFIPEHWRGDPELGIILHERMVKR